MLKVVFYEPTFWTCRFFILCTNFTAEQVEIGRRKDAVGATKYVYIYTKVVINLRLTIPDPKKKSIYQFTLKATWEMLHLSYVFIFTPKKKDCFCI